MSAGARSWSGAAGIMGHVEAHVRTDSLLSHTLQRAARDAANPWAVAKAGTKAGRMTSFVIEWALMQQELERDDLSVEDYITWSHVPRRTCYRRSAEYRELYPDLDINELARRVNEAAAANAARPSLSLSVAL